ncbi:MAG: MoxR family ATPase [Proteobacteria bacterium]|nr:MoxR family ATPase [Pseudomonadota bacterium]
MKHTHIDKIDQIKRALGAVIRGKSQAIERVLVGVLGGGHVLLEDVPGVGKTTLAKALAKVLGLDFARVQFTPDLLPTDILGMNVLDPRDGSFSFHGGPIFHRLLLADEINRASPRTQSALLEAMNEGQVTLDGTSHTLPAPFFVIATQNPVDYQGTYPLPEAQLDRFLLRVSLGYPDRADEIKILFDRQLADPLDALQHVVTIDELVELQETVRNVTISDDVGHFLLSLTEATRDHLDLELGASPRAALALFRASQAAALLQGRDWAGPADVQSIAGPVLEHRLLLTTQARYGGKTTNDVVGEIINSTKVPK